MRKCILLAVLLCLATAFAHAEETFALLVNGNLLVPFQQVASFCGATIKQPSEHEINIYLDGKITGTIYTHQQKEFSLDGVFLLNGVHFIDPFFIIGSLHGEVSWDPLARIATVRNPVTQQTLALPLAGTICTAKEEIFAAVQANDLQAATRILQQHPDQVMAFTQAGSRPLNWAVRVASPEMVMLLLKAGANPNITKIASSTPLLDAIEMQNIPMAELLLNNRADPNIGFLANRPLNMAVTTGNLALIELLLKHGANVNYMDEVTRPSLQTACSAGKLDIAKLLLAHGADPNIKYQNKYTALAIATQRQDQPMIELLTKYDGRL